MAWYDRQISDVIDALKTNTDRGLSGDEANKRLAEDGPNALAVVYLPFGYLVLGTVPIQGNHPLMVIMISALPTFALSGIKEIFSLRWL